MSLGDPLAPNLNGDDSSARGADFIELSWQSVTDAERYIVRCGSRSQSFNIPTVPFNCRFSGLDVDSPYSVTLEVRDNLGNSKVSPGAEFFTRPDPPSFLTLFPPSRESRRSTSVVLNWEEVPGVSMYEIELNTGELRQTGPPIPNGFEFIGLDANQNYVFYVRSLVTRPSGNLDSSHNSPSLSVTTRPPSVSGLKAVPLSNHQIAIGWDPISPFNDDAGAILELGRSLGSNPEDDVFFSTNDLSMDWRTVDIEILRPIILGARLVVGVNESTWSTIPFSLRNTSATFSHHISKRKSNENRNFVIRLLRGVNE